MNNLFDKFFSALTSDTFHGATFLAFHEFVSRSGSEIFFGPRNLHAIENPFMMVDSLRLANEMENYDQLSIAWRLTQIRSLANRSHSRVITRNTSNEQP
jgi:hypothetical protein